jgi:hypothetical protein
MLVNNWDYPEKFERIHNEYIEFFIEYIILMRVLEETYLKPIFNNNIIPYWQLNFITGEIEYD